MKLTNASNRITNPNIKKSDVGANDIFVPGTNESGIHGAGAALFGFEELGMQWGKGFGHTGQCFGIPTKDKRIKTLPIESIKKYVERFIEYTKTRPDLIFHVTAIGTGLAGYKADQIAPLFKETVSLENIYLPIEFLEILMKDAV